MCKKTMFFYLRFFLYGLILFSGICLLSDFPDYMAAVPRSLWGTDLTLIYGLLGGGLFLLTGFAIECIKRGFNILSGNF